MSVNFELPQNYARPQEYNLWNVNNTSDSGKPISVATQEALDTKAGLDNPTLIDLTVKNAITLQSDAGEAGGFMQLVAGVDKVVATHSVKYNMILPTTASVGAYVILQGGSEVYRIDTVNNQIQHGTNRQVCSQPIPVAEYLGTSGNYTINANTTTSVYTCNTGFDSNTFNIDIDNCYEGKTLRFVSSGGVGKIKISPESSPGVGVFLYEGTGGGAVTVFEAGTGQGYDVLFAVVAGQLIGRVTV